jgi:hypothetical protein
MITAAASPTFTRGGRVRITGDNLTTAVVPHLVPDRNAALSVAAPSSGAAIYSLPGGEEWGWRTRGNPIGGR